jgi:hypothetical protein
VDPDRWPDLGAMMGLVSPEIKDPCAARRALVRGRDGPEGGGRASGPAGRPGTDAAPDAVMSRHSPAVRTLLEARHERRQLRGHVDRLGPERFQQGEDLVALLVAEENNDPGLARRVGELRAQGRRL